jgi:hypothetical protein
MRANFTKTEIAIFLVVMVILTGAIVEGVYYWVAVDVAPPIE